MKFAKLMNESGSHIADPKLVDGSINWSERDGKASAWASDGKLMLAEMSNARVAWVGPKGIRIEGMEPVDAHGAKFRAMAWQLIF